MKRALISITAIIFFIELFDTTVLYACALPIAKDFIIPPAAMALPIIAYIIGTCIIVPAIAWLANAYNRTNIIIVSIAAFALFSLGCGISQHIIVFTMFRFLQGLTISISSTTVSIALLSECEGAELVKVMSKINIPALFGTAVGPFVGALFSSYISWRIIFLINLPVCLVIFFVLLHNKRKLITVKSEVHQFDWAGLILLSIFFVTVSLAFERLSHAFKIIYLCIIFISILFAISYFFLWRFRQMRCLSNSILDLNVFKNKDFLYGTVINIITRIAVCGLPILLNIILQQEYNYSIIKAGFYLAIIAFAGIVAKFFSTLIEKLGLYKSIMIFSLLTFFTVIMLSELGYFISKNILWVVCSLFGFFMSILFTAMNSVMFISTKRLDISNASNIGMITNQISIGLGVALALSGIQRTFPKYQITKASVVSFAINGYHNICLLLALLLLFNIFITIIFNKMKTKHQLKIVK